MKKQHSPFSPRKSNEGIIRGLKPEFSSHSKRSQSSGVLQNYKPRTSQYSLLPRDSTQEDLSEIALYFECEGIPLHSRGKSKGTCYFECCSRRLKNAPDCNFRAKVKNFNSSAKLGPIEITQEHSKTCKYMAGNTTTEFKNNIPSSIRIYKTTKIEIEKKLEEEDWLTPLQVLKWIQDKFPLESHLSYSQVDEIVQSWRKKNSASKESYVFAHSKTKTGLPFLRGHFYLNFKKNNSNTSLKITIWASDFQINRLRLTHHWYLDGTFTITPSQYSNHFGHQRS